MSRILCIRLGAYGDMILITPFLRYLKSQGHEIYLNTSDRGMEIFQEPSPFIDKMVYYKARSIPDAQFEEYWASLQQAYECDETINLCESIEVALACHPSDPAYMWSKAERRVKCNKNYYEYTFEHGGHPWDGQASLIPELTFSQDEELQMSRYFATFEGAPVLIWGLSGSSRNKAYPWAEYVQMDLLKAYPELKIITVGDVSCQLLETIEHPRLIRQSGRWKIREAMLATKYAHLVVSPDTGLLHAAGCYDTPKVGLLGHSTIENITKHFKNDYSLEADPELAPCAPCFRLIGDAMTQCPTDPLSAGVACMTWGLPAEKVKQRILDVLATVSKVKVPA